MKEEDNVSHNEMNSGNEKVTPVSNKEVLTDQKSLTEENPDQHKHQEKIDEDPTKFNVNLNVRENISGLLAFLKSTVSFKKGVKKRETMSNIKRDIVFEGHNVWILVCSMVIASIGLNMDSPAVVIGAMLISPLMSPILGVGLGVATVDLKLIYSSLKNFGLMIAISLVASFLYFLLSPVKSVTPELFGRVKPTAFDIPIAFFGGLAGIIAASRGTGASNVIPGVAIATALMPPLCTTGYGLATGHWEFAAGAFYLFLLNCLFICLATILTLRYLKFPQREFVHERVEKKAKFYMYIVFGVIIVPAIWLSVSTIRESKFEANADEFIQDVVMIDENVEVTYEADFPKKKLSVTVKSDEVLITDAVEEQWRLQLPNYGLEETSLVVYKNEIEKQIEQKLKEAKLFDNGSNEGYKIINQKEKVIKDLKSEIDVLKLKQDSLGSYNLNESGITKFIKSEYKKINEFNVYSNDMSILVILGKNQVDSTTQLMLKKELSAFMKGKGMSQKEIRIIE